VLWNVHAWKFALEGLETYTSLPSCAQAPLLLNVVRVNRCVPEFKNTPAPINA
jgi:hypothetical protein